MEVISQNIANANTTRGVDGQPYARAQVVFEAVLGEASAVGASSSTVRVARIEQDTRPARQVHNPGHPEADANGMVSLPNINIHEEMADLMIANRAYEANLSVIRNGRALAQQALSIGRR